MTFFEQLGKSKWFIITYLALFVFLAAKELYVILIFYIAVFLFFVIISAKRKADIQGGIIVLYRMALGIPLIEKTASKFREWVRIFGYMSAGIGFIGMVTIVVSLFASLYLLVFRPEAEGTGVALVLPGVEVPGLGMLPFWHWLIAIFMIAALHEFSHGIVANAHGLRVKATGIAMFGPILGAFVEPEEKKLTESSDIVQYSVYGAGAFANIISGVMAFILLSSVLVPVQQSLVEPAGFIFNGYYNTSYPAEKAGLIPGDPIIGVNGLAVNEFNDFSKVMLCAKPGQVFEIKSRHSAANVTAVSHPQDPNAPFLGITNIQNNYELKDGKSAFFNNALLVLISFFRWFGFLSLGIGLFNLLPLPIVDGGRIAQTFLKKLRGEHGEKIYRRVSGFFLLMLLVILALSFANPFAG